ncbi:hypothetical protein CEXT_699691 [Caerostris extrusa]|uniref:Uncharacterized protein n=1 Tax=Caerostris extrusa TaxID=172846 RepID=A0AAV4TAN8_CAEEX|nr:hypothetical protein CEXT_699691 [Caerostris extrusa]
MMLNLLRKYWRWPLKKENKEKEKKMKDKENPNWKRRALDNELELARIRAREIPSDLTEVSNSRRKSRGTRRGDNVLDPRDLRDISKGKLYLDQIDEGYWSTKITRTGRHVKIPEKLNFQNFLSLIFRCISLL